VLLQGARCVRRERTSRRLLDVDGANNKRGGPFGDRALGVETERGDDLRGLGLGAELQLLALRRVGVAAPADQARAERVAAIFGKKSVDGPPTEGDRRVVS